MVKPQPSHGVGIDQLWKQKAEAAKQLTAHGNGSADTQDAVPGGEVRRLRDVLAGNNENEANGAKDRGKDLHDPV